MMKIVILGTGNVARFFLQQLAAQKVDVVQLYNHRAESAQDLSIQYGIPLVTETNAINTDADLYLFCIKDQAIAALAAGIKLKPTQTAVHCAGSQSLDLLAATGTNTAVVWPLYSINKNKLPQERTVPLVVEASNNFAAQQAEAFAALISDHITPVSFAQRQYLHLSAVMVNNFTNHLLAIGAQICAEQSLPYDLLKPIIAQTFTSAMTQDPYSLQTGPAVRNDVRTMDVHVQLLQTHPEWESLYRAISNSIEKMHS
jgi:pyrroline-5-carboxylate reductase